MTSNFKIIDFREIEFAGRLIDLHNNFKFAGYDYNVVKKVLLMKFEIGKGAWIQKDELQQVNFLHTNVTYVDADGGQHTEITEDSRTLGEITFYPASDRGENLNFLNRQSPLDEDDLIYTFESGKIVRVCCEDVTLQI